MILTNTQPKFSDPQTLEADNLVQCDHCQHWFTNEEIEIIGDNQTICYACQDRKTDPYEDDII